MSRNSKHDLCKKSTKHCVGARILRVRTVRNSIKIDTKSLQNEGAQKASQKPLQKSILGRILASKTLPKSKKKPLETMVKKRHEKKGQKSANETQLGNPPASEQGESSTLPPSHSLPYNFYFPDPNVHSPYRLFPSSTSPRSGSTWHPPLPQTPSPYQRYIHPNATPFAVPALPVIHRPPGVWCMNAASDVK